MGAETGAYCELELEQRFYAVFNQHLVCIRCLWLAGISFLNWWLCSVIPPFLLLNKPNSEEIVVSGFVGVILSSR
jgi:hypothetical protein